MQQGFSPILPLAVALLIGIVGGAVLVNILLGSRIRSLLPEHSDSTPTSNVLGIARAADPPPGALTSEVLQKQEEIRRQQHDLMSKWRALAAILIPAQPQTKRHIVQ